VGPRADVGVWDNKFLAPGGSSPEGIHKPTALSGVIPAKGTKIYKNTS
jgi:hypothetical protein